MTARQKEIDELNALNGPGPHFLKSDCNDASLAAARDAAFEVRVDNEAMRLANLGKPAGTAREYEINAQKPVARLRLMAQLRPEASGLYGKQAETRARIAQIDIERANAEREEAELLRSQQEWDSLQNRRKDCVAKIDRARQRMKECKVIVSENAAEVGKMFLSDWDNANGRNLLGAILDTYTHKLAAEAALADAARLEREWTALLTAMDKEISEFKKAHDF